MAGCGPPPKHQSVRARTNKASTRATLVEPEDPEGIDIPDLPPHQVEVQYEMPNGHRETRLVEKPWHPLVIAWWNAIWPSPMAAEWHPSDIFGLYAVAFLYDKFFRSPNEKTHGALRLAMSPYGLTPIDRRKLEWTIEGTVKAQRENRRAEAKTKAPQAPPSPDDDIRLRVV